MITVRESQKRPETAETGSCVCQCFISMVLNQSTLLFMIVMVIICYVNVHVYLDPQFVP